MLYCFHGTDNENFEAHVGLCLTTSELAAHDYGQNVFPLWLSLDGLRVVDANHLVDDANQDYPGDKDPSALAEALSADVIFYDDDTDQGRQHKTWRLLTPAAVAAVVASAEPRRGGPVMDYASERAKLGAIGERMLPEWEPEIVGNIWLHNAQVEARLWLEAGFSLEEAVEWLDAIQETIKNFKFWQSPRPKAVRALVEWGITPEMLPRHGYRIDKLNRIARELIEDKGLFSEEDPEIEEFIWAGGVPPAAVRDAAIAAYENMPK